MKSAKSASGKMMVRMSTTRTRFGAALMECSVSRRRGVTSACTEHVIHGFCPMSGHLVRRRFDLRGYVVECSATGFQSSLPGLSSKVMPRGAEHVSFFVLDL